MLRNVKKNQKFSHFKLLVNKRISKIQYQICADVLLKNKMDKQCKFYGKDKKKIQITYRNHGIRILGISINHLFSIDSYIIIFVWVLTHALIKLTLTESERKGNEIVNSRKEGCKWNKLKLSWRNIAYQNILNYKNLQINFC